MHRELNQWQFDGLGVMQALLGVISSNFRMVSFSRKINTLTIRIALEQENEEDSAEIEDFKFELSVLLDQDDKIEIQLIVSDQPIIMAPPSESDITVFRRRE
jgi:hypothetical protein